MQKVVKESYEAIVSDLQPLFDKWGADVINGVMWRYIRTRSRLEELKEKKEQIDKELSQYEKDA